MSTDSFILSRLEAIEAEIAELRKQLEAKPRRTVRSLKGMLKGMDVTEEDLAQARKSGQARIDDA